MIKIPILLSFISIILVYLVKITLVYFFGKGLLTHFTGIIDSLVVYIFDLFGLDKSILEKDFKLLNIIRHIIIILLIIIYIIILVNLTDFISKNIY
jgi:hypothetical protein